MVTKRTYVIITLFLMISCDLLRVGSYPYAEYYTFEIH